MKRSAATVASVVGWVLGRNLVLLTCLTLLACSLEGPAEDDTAPGSVPQRGASAAGAVNEDGAAFEGVADGAVVADIARRRGRPELMQSLRQAAAAPRHVGDGGGRAWLASGDGVTAGAAGRWRIVYEAGPHGIAVGGRLFLQVSPFWGWSTPQVTDSRAPGFTEVSSRAAGVTLEAATVDQQLLAVTVGGRALRAGEQVVLDYGAGAAGAVADRFAERQSRFWIAVDADGDGVREVLKDSPGVDVGAGSAARLLLFLPSTAHPEETVSLVVALVDGRGNAGVPETGRLELSVVDGLDLGLQLPDALQLGPQALSQEPGSDARAVGGWRFDLRPRKAGVLRLRGVFHSTTGRTIEAESNPLQVTEGGARILWGDLQNHSAVSDGTGLPEDLFRYARDIAALDVFSLTDHDHWGMLFYDQHPELWRQALEVTERFHRPGDFVTIVGYEWTHWSHGHRHVLDFAPPYELLSSLDPRYDTPQKLWQGLAALGGPAVTLAHHSAGGPVATDWSVPPDRRFEPVTEIVSVHGSSEALDGPGVIYQAVPGNFVRDALDRGYGLGFVGSSDGHDGHPGLGHLASASGGLAAILSQDLSRQGVYDALMARRVYATNGPRIILRCNFGGYPMGSTIDLDSTAEPPIAGMPPNTLVAQVIAPGGLEHLDVIRSGEVLGRSSCEGKRTCSLALPMDDLQPSEYLYVRALQRDGGAAWSSPFFFVAGAPSKAPTTSPPSEE